MMAQEIVTWCDIHLVASDTRIIATHEDAFSANGQPWAIETCDDCYEAEIKPIQEFLQRYGHKDDGQPVAATTVASNRKRHKCLDPNCHRTWVKRNEMLKHAESVHGYIFEDTTPKQLEVAEQLELGDDSQPTCGVCGKTAQNQQGLAAHVRLAHKVKDLPNLTNEERRKYGLTVKD